MCQCVWLDGFVVAMLCAAVRLTSLENGRCSAALVVARACMVLSVVGLWFNRERYWRVGYLCCVYGGQHAPVRTLLLLVVGVMCV
jgi:hypothetical protein